MIESWCSTEAGICFMHGLHLFVTSLVRSTTRLQAIATEMKKEAALVLSGRNPSA